MHLLWLNSKAEAKVSSFSHLGGKGTWMTCHCDEFGNKNDTGLKRGLVDF